MMKMLNAAVVSILLCFALTPSVVAQFNSFTRSGLDLTAEDWELLEAAAAKLYSTEDRSVGAVENWVNQESGNRGSIELIRSGERQGMPCRRLQHDIRIRGAADPYRFTVDRCKTPEGAWKIL